MSLNLSIFELSVLFFCAVTLGFVIHFFITSRRNLKGSSMEQAKVKKNVDDWKQKYFNEVEVREKELTGIKDRLSEAEENNRIYQIEIEELKKINKKQHTGLESGSKSEEGRPNYLDQLRMAQESLMEHNEKINLLLENIDVIKENEEKQKIIVEENEELLSQVKELKYTLSQKESEIKNIMQKELLTKEMSSMLDNAYTDFNNLQSKIQKLESQLSTNKMISLEFEDLKEAYYKISRDHEEQKQKHQAVVLENQQITQQLNEMEDKLRDAIFQRQQLQKRVGFLEDLNSDLQLVADANKKLEHQIRRIGELESMLNVVSEERDLLKKQTDS